MALGLVHELTAELSLATSGVGFIARCLDRLVERLELTDAVAVLHDPVLGPQIFTAGRRPLPIDIVPSVLLDRGAGIHTEPTVIDHAADLEAIRHLCEIAPPARPPPVRVAARPAHRSLQPARVRGPARPRGQPGPALPLDVRARRARPRRLQDDQRPPRPPAGRRRPPRRRRATAARAAGRRRRRPARRRRVRPHHPRRRRAGARARSSTGSASAPRWATTKPTTSAGRSACRSAPTTAPPPTSCYRVADTRLYEAKSLREGRQRWQIPMSTAGPR